MAKKPSCSKVPYLTKREALDALAYIRRKSGEEGMVAYPCQECGRYHLGHKKYFDLTRDGEPIHRSPGRIFRKPGTRRKPSLP